MAAAAAADNGYNMVVTPQCMFAILVGTSIVTPPVYKEKRCKARMKKYKKRGLD